MSRPGKEASGRVHEKHQLILADLLREEDNRFCADCLSKGPRWASWNLGVFMCIRCAGIHRNLGVHISRVKSVNLDAWTPEQIESIQKGGNKKAKEFYEANLPSNFRRPQDDYAVETFIRNKYERRMYVLKDAPKEGSRTKDKEKTKQVKKSENRDELKLNQGKQKVSLPRPASTSNLSRPRPPGSPQSRPRNTANLTVPSSSGRSQSEADLIALEKKSSKTPTLDLLTDLPSPSAAVAEQPMLGMEPQTSVKDGIMSLYNSRPQYGSYTAQGYPVNAYYAQQQQAAAVRMAQQQQVQQQQVQLVQQQMEQLKLRQQQRPVAIATGHASGTASGGGQTLNPHLW